MDQATADKILERAEVKPLHLSKEPKKAMQEMMDVIDVLRGVMLEESDALKGADTKHFMALQTKKIAAAKLYQSGVLQMIERKDDMKSAPQSMKVKLERMRTDFMSIAEDNMNALERTRRGMKRLSDRIMTTAKSEAERAQKFSYGAHGKLEGSGKASIGVNESA